MTVTIKEAAGARKWKVDGQGTSFRRNFIASGSDEENDIFAAMIAALGGVIPETLNGFPISGAEVEEVISAEDDYWTIGIDYGVQRIPQQTASPEDWEWEEGTKSERVKVSHMAELYGSHNAPTFATVNNKLAINPQPDGKIEGTDRAASTGTFTLTGYVLESDYFDTYGPAWRAARDGVNQFAWRGFAPRCIQFEGFSAKGRVINFLDPSAELLVKCTLQFGYREPVSGDSVGLITGISYAGFDCVSQMVRPYEDPHSHKTIALTTQVDVGRIDALVNFSTLGV